MSSHNYNFHDDTFRLEKARDYTLLIQIGKTSFSYAVTDQTKLIALADNHPLDELTNPQELLDLLSANYKNVVIGLPATGFSLLPKNLFEQGKTEVLARLLDVKPDEKVLTQPLDEENVILYKTPAYLVNAAEDFGLKNAVFSSKGWLTAIARTNPEDKALFLNINGQVVEIANFNDHKLHFYNTFDFTGDDELTYFTALVADELALQPYNTHLILSGEIGLSDEKMRHLAEFFGKVTISSMQILQLPYEIEAHNIQSLAALSLCVSLEVV